MPGSIGQLDQGASGPLPLRLKEFYTPDVEWMGSLTEFAKLNEYPSHGYQFTGVPRKFKLGRTTTEHRNSAVYGPSMPNDPRYVRFAGRLGNQLRLDVPMASAIGTRTKAISIMSARPTTPSIIGGRPPGRGGSGPRARSSPR